MKYIVKTKGKVYDYKQIAYSINADSKEEAERIAQERFRKDYTVADNELSASASGVNISVLISLAALAVACVISFIGFRAGTAKNAAVIRPDFMSLLYGAGIYLILLCKFTGFKKMISPGFWKGMFSDWKEPVLALLLIIVIGSFIQLLFSQMQVGFKFLNFHADVRVLALILALVAYFGSGILSLICLGLLLLLSKASLSTMAAALGNVKGLIFLACAAAGIITYVSSQPGLYQSFLNVGAMIRNPEKQLRKNLQETAENQTETES